MFENDYKNEIDKITPDGFIKYKIRNQLSKEFSKTKPKTIYFGRAVAAVLCAALIFTVGAVVGRGTRSTPKISTLSIMKTVPDYDKIYSTLSEFKPSVLDNAITYITGGGYKNYTDDFVVEEYGAIDDIAKPNANSGNTSGIEGGAGDGGHSETTVQVDGVDEADIIKTDGKYIYILSRRDEKERIKIIEAGSTPKQLSDIIITEDVYTTDLYLNGDRLVVLCCGNEKAEVAAIIYDISDPNAPEKLQACTQSGNLNTSRLIGNTLYLISNFHININKMVKSNTESYIPYISCEDFDGAVTPETVHLYDDRKSPEYTIISAFNIKDGTLISTQSVLGGTETVYSSTDNIIAAGMGGADKTQIARFKIQDGKIELKASAELNGRLLNQFSIDEYNGHFRFVLTSTYYDEGTVSKTSSTVIKIVGDSTTANSLVILDENLKLTGEIKNIAPDERVYSVRFMGDMAYFVTFRQVDPLFSVDLSDPKNPKIIGALKIPGFSNYLFPYGQGKLLGIGQDADESTGRTKGMKLSMFDISDPSNVTENDKTAIPAISSEALYNHKAVLADYEKNIISFSAYGIYKSNCFFVYSYENGSFVKRLEIETPSTGICRGIYIGKTFYIVTDYSIDYYSLASFEKIGSLKLS